MTIMRFIQFLNYGMMPGLKSGVSEYRAAAMHKWFQTRISEGLNSSQIDFYACHGKWSLDK